MQYRPVTWRKLPGWNEDAFQEALPAFRASCSVLGQRSEWTSICAGISAMNDIDATAMRMFLEQHLQPFRIEQRNGRRRELTGLITGYYEPLLRGSRTPSAQYSIPLYAPPDDLLVIDLSSVYPDLKNYRLRGRIEGKRVVPYFDRAHIESGTVLRGKEIVWVDSAIDAFFLHIQGSGRVQLEDGSMIRVAYADQNGHPYRAIGRYLIEQQLMKSKDVTAQSLREWLRNHPQRAAEVMHSNPSFVFFRETPIQEPRSEPEGALGVPLTAGRSIAIDRGAIPLGPPVFLSTTLPRTQAPLQRLVLAQDTGGAIRGAIRADLYCGSGAAAGELAGEMKQQGEMWLLWPKNAEPPHTTELK